MRPIECALCRPPLRDVLKKKRRGRKPARTQRYDMCLWRDKMSGASPQSHDGGAWGGSKMGAQSQWHHEPPPPPPTHTVLHHELSNILHALRFGSIICSPNSHTLFCLFCNLNGQFGKLSLESNSSSPGTKIPIGTCQNQNTIM